MRIEELKPSQRVQGRWLVVLDDGSILRVGEGEVIDFALFVGKELTEDEASRLTDAAHAASLKHKTLDLLTRKPQSRRELERKLGEWGAGEEETESICARMEELGLLNDAAYAGQVVRHYAARGYGVRKLRDELYRRGVPRDLWDAALSEAEDPSEAIDAFLQKKLAGNVPDRKELKKLSDALARRGYGWEDIRSAIGRLGIYPDE